MWLLTSGTYLAARHGGQVESGSCASPGSHRHISASLGLWVWFLEVVNRASLHDGGYHPQVQQTRRLLTPSSSLACRPSLTACRVPAAARLPAPLPRLTTLRARGLRLPATARCDSPSTPPTAGDPSLYSRPASAQKPAHTHPIIRSACILHQNVSQLSVQPSLHAHSLPSASLLVRDNTSILLSSYLLPGPISGPVTPTRCPASPTNAPVTIPSPAHGLLHPPLTAAAHLAALLDPLILGLACATRQSPAFFACDFDLPGCAR